MIRVVGGAGYIGSIILQALREQGLPHLNLDNFERGNRSAVGESDSVTVDIRDPRQLDKIFRTCPIDTVIHLAAYVSVSESLRDPDRYYLNNTIGLFNTLEAMRAHGVRRLVFSSTAAVYGHPQYLPIDEDHPREPTTPYGRSKVASEHLLHSYSAQYGIQCACLRYFNAAGADPIAGLGPSLQHKEDLVSLAMRAALAPSPVIEVYGSDYGTPDGTCIRDFVHVRDLADAHVKACTYLRMGGDSRTFNLGSGTGCSVREVIRAVEEVAKTEFRTISRGRREGDPMCVIASIERAKRELGWTPRRSHIDRIVNDTWRYVGARESSVAVADMRAAVNGA
jgi:UDP-glucose 4-epimerase